MGLALIRARRELPDVLIVDVHLPELDGDRSLERIFDDVEGVPPGASRAFAVR
jgi:CheY-like chemotaxis protein